jgi:hypothetical protein
MLVLVLALAVLPVPSELPLIALSLAKGAFPAMVRRAGLVPGPHV